MLITNQLVNVLYNKDKTHITHKALNNCRPG